MGEFSDLSPVPVPETLKTPPSRTLPFREDCWSEEATATLVESWGRRYVELNRGNLRQKDWQEVADAVNALHGHSKKTRRTDVQCKNRIDTLKKKYKVEKAKFVDSNGTLPSSWPFYARLDALVGPSVKNQAGARGSPQVSNSFSPSPLSMQSPPMGIPLYNKRSPLLSLPPPPLPVEPMVLPQKRQFSATDSSYFKKNYSTIAAEAFSASAAPRDGMDVDDDEDEDEDEDDVASDEDEENEVEEREVGTVQEEGMRSLAKAIERFGEIYERVENMKQKQMVELEKQRMQFAKDLEVQRMQLFMDTQVQLEKIKHSKRSGSDDIYS